MMLTTTTPLSVIDMRMAVDVCVVYIVQTLFISGPVFID
jgi:hypothetical protein